MTKADSGTPPDINEDLYVDVFKTRDDCFAIQRRNGSYAPLDIQFEAKHVKEHLEGEYTYGQYLVNPEDDTVQFACIDNDIEDDSDAPLTNALVAARRERDHAISLGLDEKQVWLEFSGRRGYHMWVFFDDPVPAAHAKALMDEIDGQVEIDGGHTEVFPKQIALQPDGYGNLVKTPLGIHQKTGNRMVFIDDDGEPLERQGDVLRVISRNRVSSDTVEEILDEIDRDPDKLEREAAELSEKRSRSIEEVIVDFPDIRPCIKDAMMGKVDHLRGDQGHSMRLAIGAELMAQGVPIDEAMNVFKQFENYSPKITRQKLEEIKREGHRPWQCKTLEDKCPRYTEDCPCPYRNPDMIESMEINRKIHGDKWGEEDG